MVVLVVVFVAIGDFQTNFFPPFDREWRFRDSKSENLIKKIFKRQGQGDMASISDPVPLPSNLSTQGSKVRATAVWNCKNEAVLAIDGEGLFIYSVLIL